MVIDGDLVFSVLRDEGLAVADLEVMWVGRLSEPELDEGRRPVAGLVDRTKSKPSRPIRKTESSEVTTTASLGMSTISSVTDHSSRSAVARAPTE